MMVHYSIERTPPENIPVQPSAGRHRITATQKDAGRTAQSADMLHHAGNIHAAHWR